MRLPAPVQALFLLVGLMLTSAYLAAGYCLSCGKSLDHETHNDFCNACYRQMHPDTDTATVNDQEKLECCFCKGEFTASENLPACSLENTVRAPSTSDLCCLPCCRETYICHSCLERMGEVRQHYCSSHLSRVYTCTLCDTAVTSEDAAEQHLFGHCVYICPYIRCRQRFLTRVQLWRHIASVIVRKLFASEPVTAPESLAVEQEQSLEVGQSLEAGDILPCLNDQFGTLHISSDEAFAWQLQLQYVSQAQPMTQEQSHYPIQQGALPCGQCFLCEAMLYDECPNKQ